MIRLQFERQAQLAELADDDDVDLDADVEQSSKRTLPSLTDKADDQRQPPKKKPATPTSSVDRSVYPVPPVSKASLRVPAKKVTQEPKQPLVEPPVTHAVAASNPSAGSDKQTPTSGVLAHGAEAQLSQASSGPYGAARRPRRSGSLTPRLDQFVNIASPIAIVEGQTVAERLASLELRDSVQHLIEAEGKRQKDEFTAERQALLERYGEKMRAFDAAQQSNAALQDHLQEAQRKEVELRSSNESLSAQADAALKCIETLQNQVASSQAQIAAVQSAGELAHQLVVREKDDAAGAQIAEHRAQLESFKQHCGVLEKRNNSIIDEAKQHIVQYQEQLAACRQQAEDAKANADQAKQDAASAVAAAEERARLAERAAEHVRQQAKHQVETASQQSSEAAKAKVESMQRRAEEELQGIAQRANQREVALLRQAEAEKTAVHHAAAEKEAALKQRLKTLEAQLAEERTLRVKASKPPSSVGVMSESSRKLKGELDFERAKNQELSDALQRTWIEKERQRQEQVVATPPAHPPLAPSPVAHVPTVPVTTGGAASASHLPPKVPNGTTPIATNGPLAQGVAMQHPDALTLDPAVPLAPTVSHWYMATPIGSQQGGIQPEGQEYHDAHEEQWWTQPIPQQSGTLSQQGIEDTSSQILARLDTIAKAISERGETEIVPKVKESAPSTKPPTTTLTGTKTLPSKSLTYSGPSGSRQANGNDGDKDPKDPKEPPKGKAPGKNVGPPGPPGPPGPGKPEDDDENSDDPDGHRHPKDEDEEHRGTTLTSKDKDGTYVTRKEADQFNFGKFDNAGTFKSVWADARREVMGKSGRKRLVHEYWSKMVDYTVSWEELEDPGEILDQLDGKVLVSFMKSTTGQLHRKIRYVEEQMEKEGKIMSGRQAGRLVHLDFTTDKVASQMFNTTHLHELVYPGDDHLEQFIGDWFAILSHQEQPVPELQLERIFYKKICNSKRLKHYIDYYNRIGEDHEDHCYRYLLESCEQSIAKAKRDNNLTALVHAASTSNSTVGAGKGKKGAALAAAKAQQCPFHLKPNGCRDPVNCTLGRHDPELKGAGDNTAVPKPPGTPGAKGAKGDQGAKGDKGGKSKGKGDKGGKGGKSSKDTPKAPPGKAPPEGQNKDANGKLPCFKFMRDPKSCTLGDKCPFGHGPYNKSQKELFKKNETDTESQRQAQKTAAAAKKAEAAGASGADDAAANGAAQPKAKSKV